MFDSGISLKELVADLKEEVDVAIPIPNKSYVSWANSLEHLLYTEIIKEQNEIAVNATEGPIEIEALDVPDGESRVRFEDVRAVYADTTQLILSTAASGIIFPNSFYKTENKIGVNVDFEPSVYRIIYYVKPSLKTVDANDNISEEHVMLPIEFVEIMKSKLRGEAYRIANEDAKAANWLNNYNVLLENFKAWIAQKGAPLGL